MVSGTGDPQIFEEERERLHRHMLSCVSHDLKTPMASIIGALEVIDRAKDKLSHEKQEQLISVALQEAYRLDSFITNILDMARLENNMVKARHENAEIGDLIRHCLTRADTRLRGSQIIFEPKGAISVATDSVLLCRAISLVLDNAVKFGGMPLVLHIDCGVDENNAGYIGIRDNGGGIVEDKMEIIFSKYTRFGKEDQQNAGTGLGLAISRAIMNLLGGSIAAANHPDGGALLTLRFPLIKAAA
jgi:two-component system sensor histidine kinase KdpD